MAVKDTIQSIKNNVANAYSKLQSKGATIPTNKNIENLASTIDSVTSGGVTPEGTLLINTNGVYDVVDYANVDVQVSTPSQPIEPPVLAIKNITENGTYYASDDGADGYSSVIVNVETEPNLQEKTATDNGEVVADSGYDGLSKVIVNVEKGVFPEGTLDITENGEHNVATYEKVNVNVAGGGSGEDTLTAFQNNTLENLTDAGECLPYKYYNKTALKNVNINSNISITSQYVFYGCTSIEDGSITISGSGSIGNFGFYQVGKNATSSSLKINARTNGGMSEFQDAKFDEAILTSSSSTMKSTSYKDMFNNCQANKVTISGLSTLGPFNNGTYAVGFQSKIGKTYLPNLSTISSYGLYGFPKIFLSKGTTLSSATSDIAYTAKVFIPHTLIDTYSQTTNWTTLFTNDGAEETRMFVWNEFASGDTLPAQIGTTQVYNVTWYEDDDFTTLASGTATSDKEYYGKISAVV